MGGEEVVVLRRQEEAQDSAGASQQRWIRLGWMSDVQEYSPAFPKEKTAFVTGNAL